MNFLRLRLSQFHFESRSLERVRAAAIASLRPRLLELSLHLRSLPASVTAWTLWTQSTSWTQLRLRLPCPCSELVPRYWDHCRLGCWQQGQSTEHSTQEQLML